MALSDRHAKLLEARGIDVELAERLGVTSCDRHGPDTIRIPFFEGGSEVNAKYRTISGDKKFSQETGARKCFWNVDAISDPSLQGLPLIVTEGEFDAMAAIQAGYGRVVSVPDGAPPEEIADKPTTKYSFLDNAPGQLREVNEIILATDSDGPGVNLLNDLALRLGKARCKWVRYPIGCKDLNDALVKYGQRGVTETITRAQWMLVDGVYRLSELPPVPPVKPLEIGIESLEKHFRMRPGDFSVVTGIPSHGKTTVVNEIACRMAARYHWPIAVASFEQQPQVDHRRNLRTWYHAKIVAHQSPEEIVQADAWIDENFVFIVPNEDDDVTLAWTLERCAAAVVRYGAKLIVIDPWNEMDHIRPSDMSLTEYVGFAIKQFKKFARKHQVHLMIVAHPAKMRKGDDGKIPMPSLYDISDSAHWYNKPDVGIIVHRLDEERTIIRVAKSRYHDQIGEPGEIVARFNRDRCAYEVIRGAPA